MKNAIIAILAAACGYLLLAALGAFEFGSFIDHEHHSYYVGLRAKAVNAAPEYLIGAVYNEKDWVDVDTMRGVALAVDMVNAGNSGKPYTLVSHGSVYTKKQNNAAIQVFAGNADTAALIGPFESMHVPSSRALTQFFGLPLLSPVTIASDKLPPLEPDNFVPVFPPLQLWVRAVLEHMKERGIKNLFILSSGEGTYGDIFCTEMERSSRQGFDQVFRLVYQEPLRRQDIERLLLSHAEDEKFQAVFFGGRFQDYAEFSAMMEDHQISLPVYGSDDLYSPEIIDSPRSFDLYLPRAIQKSEHQDFDRQWKELYGRGPGFHARYGAETIFLLAGVLNKADGYDAHGIVEAMRKSIQEQQSNPERAAKIVVDAFYGHKRGGSDSLPESLSE